MFLVHFARWALSSAAARGRRLLYATALLLTMAPQAGVGLAGDCTQPSNNGCPIDVNEAATAVLANAGDVHSWVLTLGSVAPLHIVLTNLNAGYGLHVYAADGSLLGESTSDGNHDDVVDLQQVGAGRYTINIDSPGGDISDQPYSLIVGAPNSVAASAAAATSGAAPPGTLLLADDFSDPENGRLPSGPASNGFVKYLDGEYEIAQTNAGNPWPGVQIPGTYSDSSVAFDVRFVTPAPTVALSIGCRQQQGHTYFARVDPQMHTASLARFDATTQTNLVPARPERALHPDSSNHIELICAGTTIALFLNGTLVASAQDAAYASGGLYINAGNSIGTSDARLAHLVVTQPDAGAIPAAAPMGQPASYRVLPKDTDPAIDEALGPHLVTVANCEQRPGYLVLWLPGTDGSAVGQDGVQMLNVATQNCLDGISLQYTTANVVFSDWNDCLRDRNTDCYEQWHLQKVDGISRSPFFPATPANSIQNRLLKLLAYLSRTHPNEGWDTYLDNTGVRWDHIIVSGASQGGALAAMIGHVHLTARVAMFAAPPDTIGGLDGPSSPWVGKPSATAPDRYFGFAHVHDLWWPAEQKNWATLSLNQFGPIVNVDSATPPFGHSHMLTTDIPYDPGPPTGPNGLPRGGHSTVFDPRNTGIFYHVWEYLLVPGQ